MWLPYGNLITQILEHAGFNFEKEEFVEHVPKIGETVLISMKYEIINEKLTENTSNENKTNANDQEEPLDLEYFDYNMSQLPITGDLLKVIIQKNDTTNEKTDFITRQFVKDQELTSQNLFLNDDFDE